MISLPEFAPYCELKKYHKRIAMAKQGTRRVKFFRRLFPVLTLLLIVWISVFVSVAHFVPDINFLSLGLTRDALVMQKPEVSGQAGSRHYKITASRAVQKIKTPHKVSLEDVRAHIQDPADTDVTLTANTGFYDANEERLGLKGGVHVTSSQGTMYFEEVTADLKTGLLTIPTPLQLISEKNQLQAGRLSVEKEGKVMHFTGGVRTRFVPQSSTHVSPQTGVPPLPVITTALLPQKKP